MSSAAAISSGWFDSDCWNTRAVPWKVPWIVAGLVLYAVTLAITFIVNVPLNNALIAAGSPDASGDVGAIRTAFEARWVAFNTARAVVGTAAFACLAWAMHLVGHNG